jgi:hypothetical protein
MEVKAVKKRNTITSDINNSTRTAYRKFVKETGRSDISYEVFGDVVEVMHEKMFEKIQKGIYSIKIPKMGVMKLLRVQALGGPHTKIDWGRYNAQNIWAPHRNNHSDGLIYKVHTYFYEKKYPMLSFFKFKLSQKHRRHLAQLIKNNKLQ